MFDQNVIRMFLWSIVVKKKKRLITTITNMSSGGYFESIPQKKSIKRADICKIKAGLSDICYSDWWV